MATPDAPADLPERAEHSAELRKDPASEPANGAQVANMTDDAAKSVAKTPNWIERVLPMPQTGSYLGLVVYLLSTLFTICFLVFLNSAQGFTLSTILGVPASDLGSISGTLGLIDQCVSLPFAWLWGVLSDRYIPRPAIYTIGFLITSVTCFAFPNIPTWNPGLIVLRCFFAIGSAACTAMLTAVLGDFSVPGTGGKLAGAVGLATGVGALIALFVFLRIPTWTGNESSVGSIKTAYYVVGVVAAIWGIVAFFGLRPRKARAATPDHLVEDQKQAQPTATPENEDTELEPTFLQSIWIGIKAAKDPRVLLGYLGAFPARGDSVTLTLYLPLFFGYYYISTGLCPKPDWDLSDPDAIKEACREAYSKASSVSGVAQVLALVTALFWGFAADKFNKITVLVVASVVGAIGYIGMMFTTDPRRGVTFAFASLLGAAEAGLIVSSLSLVADTAYVPARSKGSIAGFYSFIGALGILITTKVGGELFDIAPRWAWTVGFVACVFVAITSVVVLVFARKPVGWRRTRSEGAAEVEGKTSGV